MKWHNCIITWVLGLTAYFSIEFGSISVRISKVNRLDWITSIYYSNPSLMHHHPSIHLTLVPKPTSTLHWFIENNNSGLVIPKLENSEVFQNSTRSVLSLLTYWLHKRATVSCFKNVIFWNKLVTFPTNQNQIECLRSSE